MPTSYLLTEKGIVYMSPHLTPAERTQVLNKVATRHGKNTAVETPKKCRHCYSRLAAYGKIYCDSPACISARRHYEARLSRGFSKSLNNKYENLSPRNKKFLCFGVALMVFAVLGFALGFGGR